MCIRDRYKSFPTLKEAQEYLTGGQTGDAAPDEKDPNVCVAYVDGSFDAKMCIRDRSYIDSLAVCGNTMVGYTSRPKTDIPFVEKHIQTILRQNGYYVSVKIFDRLSDYTGRLDTMWEHREALEKDIKFRPDPQEPDLTRNEAIMRVIYAISL